MQYFAILFKIKKMKQYGEFRDKFDITLTCASGVEKVVKSELKRLGYEDVPAVNGSLTFSGTPLDVCRCNLFLRPPIYTNQIS